MNYRILIPARAGSKGFPRKNLKLFDYTASSIPKSFADRVTVLTDDPDIAEKAFSWGFNHVNRPAIAQQLAYFPHSEIMLNYTLTYKYLCMLFG